MDTWRALKPGQWQVTPETARLLEHWRHHPFNNQRPFFCQIEAVETAIWLTEGWDANNFTNVLGVRAFGTQLLCEQVLGRALRRLSYEIQADFKAKVEAQFNALIETVAAPSVP